jgi:hypothetical protein
LEGSEKKIRKLERLEDWKNCYEVCLLLLHHIVPTIFKKDFKEIAMDFYFLHHFLEKAEDHKKK